MGALLLPGFLGVSVYSACIIILGGLYNKMATNCLLVYRMIKITCSMILEHRPLMTSAIDSCIFFPFSSSSLPSVNQINVTVFCIGHEVGYTCILSVIHTETNCILLYFTIPSCLPLILISAWM
jgi:hypothetical protein